MYSISFGIIQIRRWTKIQLTINYVAINTAWSKVCLLFEKKSFEHTHMYVTNFTKGNTLNTLNYTKEPIIYNELCFLTQKDK